MKKQASHFNLPPELIAQYPLTHRSDSRLLVYNRANQTYDHQQFKHIAQYLEPGDLLVMNDSQVIPARLYGHKASGGKVELLIERIIDETTCLAHIKASKSPKPETILHLNSNWHIKIITKEGDLYRCEANGSIDTMLHAIGHIPLPPYIERQDESFDLKRYQTVYARHKGSVAAPTAGLHFDDIVLKRLKNAGVNVAYVTLHVGAGTFRPVREENILAHKMHAEQFSVSEALCDVVQQTQKAGKRVIAVGTTALRSLESAASEHGELKPCHRETDIFIFPGYQCKVCQGLITNFHLPESTLLMLVAAFIGYEQAMAMYQLAIQEKYRFFSYGDASLLL